MMETGKYGSEETQRNEKKTKACTDTKKEERSGDPVRLKNSPPTSGKGRGEREKKGQKSDYHAVKKAEGS